MTRFVCAAIASVLLVGCSSEPATQAETAAEAQAAPSSDAEIIARAITAAPADLAANAAVVEPNMDTMEMREVRPGTNGWVCMAHPEVMCLDAQWQEWADAWMNKRAPNITGLGIGYMLQGDVGASNVDPYATEATPDNQWVTSPAHLMIVTPNAVELDTLPTDPYNGGPWVMWKGTPLAHVMVPIVPMPARPAN